MSGFGYTMLFLDLEGTVIKTHLDPTFIDTHKEFLYGKSVIIFSTIFCDIDDFDGYNLSILESCKKYFNIEIVDISKLGSLYKLVQKPSKQNLFIEYVKLHGKAGDKYQLLDDTVVAGDINIDGKLISFIRA